MTLIVFVTFLVTPHPDQLLHGRALDVVQEVAVPVVRIRDEGNLGCGPPGLPRGELACQGRGERDRGHDFRFDESGDIVVVGRAQGVTVLAVRRGGQHDDAVEAAVIVRYELEHPLHGLGTQWIEMLNLDRDRLQLLNAGTQVA
ncbi:MAG: hypothetical protein P8172_17005 [Gammaproteobacteria bacterium]